MKCPKCEEGKLTKIKFKNSERTAKLCEFCGEIWYDKESLNETNGHVFESQTSSEKQEYTFEDAEFDQDSKDINYLKFK